MTTMQTHLRTMSTSELKEFKRQITPNATQIFATTLTNKKTPTNPLNRETSPHANQTFTETPPSKETDPHPSKSRKKLAQALKKRAKYEAEQRARTPHPDRPQKTLTDALKQHNEQWNKRPIRTYAERIRELIGSPEQCAECGKEHPTRLCMKRFKKL